MAENPMRKKQPTSDYCFICGRKNPVGLKMHFYTTASDEVTADYTIPDHYQGYPGIVHGGIVASILDETAGRSVMADGDDRFFVTVTMNITYRNPVPTETPVKILGRLKSKRGRRAMVSGEIRSLEGQVLAEAEALLYLIPEKVQKAGNREDFGWRVEED